MKKLIILMMMVMIIPTVLAEPSYFFQRDNPVDLKIPVFDDDKKVANSSITCNISIRSPDSILLVDNANMTWTLGGVFNYTIDSSNLTKLGEYSVSQGCGNGLTWGFATFTFEVTPTGEENNIGKSITYIAGVLLLVLLIFASIFGWTNATTIHIKFIFFAIFWLLLIALNYVAWVGSANYLPRLVFLGIFFKWAFYITTLAVFPIVIGSLIYAGYMAITVPEMKNMLKHGVPEDRAMERQFRQRGGKWQ